MTALQETTASGPTTAPGRTTASGPTTAPIPASGRYRVVPADSSVAFTTRHLLGLGGVTGTFAVRSGEIRVGEPVSGSTFALTIDAASFHTGNPRRDQHVRSADSLDVARHPVIEFRGSYARPLDGAWSAEGTLTVRGVRAPLTVSATTMRRTPDGYTLIATARVDRYAWGVPRFKGLAARQVRLTIAVSAARA